MRKWTIFKIIFQYYWIKKECNRKVVSILVYKWVCRWPHHPSTRGLAVALDKLDSSQMECSQDEWKMAAKWKSYFEFMMIFVTSSTAEQQNHHWRYSHTLMIVLVLLHNLTKEINAKILTIKYFLHYRKINIYFLTNRWILFHVATLIKLGVFRSVCMWSTGQEQSLRRRGALPRPSSLIISAEHHLIISYSVRGRR